MEAQQTQALIDLARRAGDAILEIYRTDFDVEAKDDESPLTQADLAAHRLIVDGLGRLFPDIPVVSEESSPPAFDVRRTWERYWLVDPLDGTREFVNKNGEFTVNMALIEDHQAVFGVVGVPAQDIVYTGDIAAGEAIKHAGGEHTVLHGRPMKDDAELVVVASRSHGGERLEAYIEALGQRFPAVSRTPVGSSLKLCILAEGQADLYPRLGPTSEWDIAAAHAVLAAAGGAVWLTDGQPLRYNAKESFLNPEFFAAADAAYPWQERLPPVPD
ncbi:MAG: 3'(2'),5'-bisphosphate nucleotidase CysQ [Gammaproteobacteria bacterium]|nr:3'(2'),5'-bisphosphate nucleotidase CysQ [Gammaproteobacteria bacterium]